MLGEAGIVEKGAMAVLVGLVSWNVYTTQQLEVKVSVLANKVENSVTSREAALSEQRLGQLESTVGDLTARIRNLENSN